jgi:hypothetical protein
MRRAGSSSRKLPARTSSTSWHSAGEALCTDTARGRLLAAAIATILVPLPRRVGPTAKPPFWRSRRWHPRTPRPGSTGRAHVSATPVAAAPFPVSRSVPIAGIGDGRSRKADISRAVPATVRRCPRPTTHHARRRVYRATDDRAYRPGAAAATPALLRDTRAGDSPQRCVLGSPRMTAPRDYMRVNGLVLPQNISYSFFAGSFFVARKFQITSLALPAHFVRQRIHPNSTHESVSLSSIQ